MTAISSRLSTLWLTLLFLWRCTAQSITPTNGTSPRLPRNQTDQIGLQISRADGLSTPSMPALIPLTDGATDNLPTGGKSGNIFDANVNNVANITFMSIAWISCDPSDYTGNLGAIDVLQRAVENQAAAAVLYSKSSSYCNYTAGSKIDPKYTFLYSMGSARDSVSFNTMVHYNPDGMPERVTINLVERLTSNNGTGNGNGSDGAPSQSQPGGPSPSTAVAMIILYSITGVITALFLIIIITGAIRAHRHPERYGPRAVLGRARQSRAKGIARAMLDSIPIVKFGDNENDIPKPEDVELAAGSSSTNEHGTNGETREGVKQESTAETSERRGSDGGQIERTVSRDSEGGIGADVAPAATQPTKTSEHALACSICTEEFERGEDVRVLPCDHKFHPACIDPWLLNVSGTCPLCRIDLRPPTATDPNDPNSPSAEDANADGSNAQASPDSVPHPGSGEPINANLQPNETSGRQSRRFSSLLLDPLNRRRMEHATPEERIEALRQYNARRQQESRRRRISARLSDAFGRRRNDESSAEGSRSGTPANAGPNEVAPQAPMLSPLSFEERARHEAHAASDSPVSPVAEEHDEITPAPQIRVQAPGGETDAPSPIEMSKKD